VNGAVSAFIVPRWNFAPLLRLQYSRKMTDFAYPPPETDTRLFAEVYKLTDASAGAEPTPIAARGDRDGLPRFVCQVSSNMAWLPYGIGM
jgi:hypothetical protein